jgi:hypothetical protein
MSADTPKERREARDGRARLRSGIGVTKKQRDAAVARDDEYLADAARLQAEQRAKTRARLNGRSS